MHQTPQSKLTNNGLSFMAILSLMMCLMMVTVIPATAETQGITEPTTSEEDEERPDEEGPSSPEQLVTEAEETILSFEDDPELDWFRANVKNADGLLIIPGYYAAGLVVSVGGGNGVMLKQDKNTQDWNQPAFYTAGGLGAGATIGVQRSEIVVMIMSESAIEKFNETKFDLGAAGNITIGKIGGGIAEDVPGDLVVYNRSKGLWVSLNVGGMTIAVHDDYNKAYYGKSVTPKQIMSNEVTNTHSHDLQFAVKQVGKKIIRCTFCSP